MLYYQFLTNTLSRRIEEIGTILFMVALSAILNVLAWMIVGYIVGSYFSRYSRHGAKHTVTASIFGSVAAGFFTILAYGVPQTFLWTNNLLFAMIAGLGMVYVVLPEKARSVRVEQLVRGIRRLNKWYIDLAGVKQ